MKNQILLITAASLALCSCSGVVSHSLHIVSTGDVHGAYFDRRYEPGAPERTSLVGVMAYVDSLREAEGAGNVLLLDAGDALQGDQAAYYYNYVDTLSPHLYPRLVSYMGYDAVLVGNHDIETGHRVYDKVRRELEISGIPYLAGNAITPGGKPYFEEYKVFKRGGLKVLVLGYTNPNMKAWLSEEKWFGMTFESLLPLVQARVDEIKRKVRPQVTIVAVHAGSGRGDGSSLESQGLDLFNSLEGVDLLITAHDHSPLVKDKGSFSIMNGGASCGNVGHAIIDVTTSGRKVLEKTVRAEVDRIDKSNADTTMRNVFNSEYEAVKAFTLRHVGTLENEIHIRDAYAGPSDIMNLIHTVQLSVPEAKLSFSAPLTFDATIPEGELLYKDMFTLYKYENELYVVNLTGREIKDYLEYSYDKWIVNSTDHILNISPRPDPRTGAKRWSFNARSYNFDSCAGLCYTVDITKEFGDRISISSLSDGTAFSPDGTYPVAMTSYRASGGGEILPKGAGIDALEMQNRLVATYPAIRDILYEFILKNDKLSRDLYSDPSVLGTWKFIPEKKASALLERDMDLLFGHIQ